MRFKIKSGDTTFYIASADTNFVFQDNSDYTEYDVLKFTFNAETGDYQCWIENPSNTTLNALEHEDLYLGISTCDIGTRTSHEDTHPADNEDGKRFRRTIDQCRPYRITSEGNRVMWRVCKQDRTCITDLSHVHINIYNTSIPYKLRSQGHWVLKCIKKYDWPESVYKDKVSVDYKFILIGRYGRAIKSYKTIYTVELDTTILTKSLNTTEE